MLEFCVEKMEDSFSVRIFTGGDVGSMFRIIVLIFVLFLWVLEFLEIWKEDLR